MALSSPTGPHRPAFIRMTLTSPRLEHPTVSWLQALMNQSKYTRGLKEDGVFGPHTAQEAEELFYRLGRKRSIPAVGLQDILVLWRWTQGESLPVKWQARRLARMATGFKKGWGITRRSWRLLHPGQYDKAPDQADGAQEALTAAHNWIGLAENPDGSNYVQRLSEVGKWHNVKHEFRVMGYAWCAYFAFLCHLKAGSKVAEAGLVHGDFWPLYTPWLVNHARKGEHGMSVVRMEDARPGDLVFFNWKGGDFVDHVGLFKSYDRGSDTVTTIDGNISNRVGQHTRDAILAPYVVRLAN